MIMNHGYTRPLYLLPFDHRQSYVDGMFHLAPPLTSDEHAAVANSKQVIYDGFRQALGPELPIDSAGVLVDEEFGADILRDAAWNGYVTALSVEKSGSAEFEFEYGEAFAQHIEAFRPTFAKALVRYNPEGDPLLNTRQTARLKQLSDYCRAVGQRFMFELLVPATKAQMDRIQADKQIFDLRIRPELTLQTIRTLQDAGVEPDVWKIEGLDRREDCERVIEIVRREGPDAAGTCRCSHDHRDGNCLHNHQRPASTGHEDVDRRPGPPRPGCSIQRRVGRAAGPLDHSRTPGHEPGCTIGHRHLDEAQARRLGVR